MKYYSGIIVVQLLRNFGKKWKMFWRRTQSYNALCPHKLGILTEKKPEAFYLWGDIFLEKG